MKLDDVMTTQEAQNAGMLLLILLNKTVGVV